MAIAGSNLTTNSNVTPAASYNTASISPGSNRLILAAVLASDDAAATPPTLTLSGNGLTWVQVRRYVIDSETSFSLFRAMGASPSSGAVTISSDVTTFHSALWTISEYDGVDTGGTNGSAAVGNTADNAGASVTGLTVTLPAFGSANNGTYGAFIFFDGSSYNIDPGSGFTENAENTLALGGAYYVVIQSEWKASNDTGVDANANPSITLDSAYGIAIEIVAASAGSSNGAARHYYAQMMR
jgi:hypothetical protein